MTIKHYIIERSWDPNYWMVSQPIDAENIGDPKEVAIPVVVILGTALARKHPPLARVIDDPTADEIWIQTETEE